MISWGALKTWGTTNNMVQKWNIEGKDRVKFWNATKPPSFWVFAHAQHLKGVIIMRKLNVRSSLRLGHENGRSELWVGLKGLTWENILWSREWWWDRRFCECLKKSIVFVNTEGLGFFGEHWKRLCTWRQLCAWRNIKSLQHHALERGWWVDVDRESIEVTSDVNRWVSIVKALEVQVLKVDKQMSTMKVSKVIVEVGKHGFE